MNVKTLKSRPSVPLWRLKLGIAIFIIGFLSPLLIPVVKAMQIPTAWKVAISGALVVGIPEVFSVVAIAILGKSGFNVMKASIYKWIKRHGPPDKVSRSRYRIGLVMFVLPVLFGWFVPYAPDIVPGYETHRFWVNLCGDVMFVSSLFILGGDFWDKLRALFVYEAKAKFSEPSAI
jgi:hypothetical protein